ncbi:hypothetical protein [Nocardia sp. NPDC057353]|uniref:hypothetical protein n=1 Tax=Nocardia sp. NPDC057353 TaxID=3346104 RepID=UPI003640F6DF
MALKDVWFTPTFEQAFPKGLFLLGDIEPVTEFNADRSAPKRQRTDVDFEGNGTGKRLWKGTITDPAAANAKSASFEVTFVADVMPVPAAPEIVPGMRPIELEGLEIKPKIEGDGQFKRIGWKIRATGIKGDTNAPRSTGNGAGAKAVA